MRSAYIMLHVNMENKCVITEKIEYRPVALS